MAFFFSWVVAGAVVKVLAIGQVVVLGSDVSLFLSANHDENQNIKLLKNKSTISCCRNSL